jgi:hypothetical protein
MKMKDKNAYKKSLVFSICYVGFATIVLFFMYPGSFLHCDWAIGGLLITFPVSIISFGVMYGGAENAPLIILGIQIIMFLLTWYLSYRFLRGKKPRD